MSPTEQSRSSVACRISPSVRTFEMYCKNKSFCPPTLRLFTDGMGHTIQDECVDNMILPVAVKCHEWPRKRSCRPLTSDDLRSPCVVKNMIRRLKVAQHNPKAAVKLESVELVPRTLIQLDSSQSPCFRPIKKNGTLVKANLYGNWQVRLPNTLYS